MKVFADKFAISFLNPFGFQACNRIDASKYPK